MKVSQGVVGGTKPYQCLNLTCPCGLKLAIPIFEGWGKCKSYM